VRDEGQQRLARSAVRQRNRLPDLGVGAAQRLAALHLVDHRALPRRQQLVQPDRLVGAVAQLAHRAQRQVAERRGRGRAAGQLHEQRAERVSPVGGLPDQPVVLQRGQQPMGGAGGEPGGAGDLADPQLRRARPEAPQDRDGPVDGLHA
jgi:hypothetical protein